MIRHKELHDDKQHICRHCEYECAGIERVSAPGCGQFLFCPKCCEDGIYREMCLSKVPSWIKPGVLCHCWGEGSDQIFTICQIEGLCAWLEMDQCSHGWKGVNTLYSIAEGVQLIAMDYIEFEEVELIRQTERAGLFEIDGEEYWIPFSQIEENDEELKDGYVGSIFITNWLAEEKGLI